MNNPDLLLDTHVWVNYQLLPHLVRDVAADAIEEAAARQAVFISIISIWEVAFLERAGKVDLLGGAHRWCDEALSKTGINLLPLSPRIAIESVRLPQPMHKDPADRILVASARVERMTLVTSDKAVLSYAKLTGLSYLRG